MSDAPADGAQHTPNEVWLVLLFVGISVLAGWDVLSDLAEGTTLQHVAVESVALALALAGAVWAAQRLRALRAESRELRDESSQLQQRLASARQDAQRWQSEVQSLVRGLSSAIDTQLESWKLTGAEKEIALLLLKGLSHKEIAAVRQVSEATVRQQSRAVYRKAGLSGRHDLAAFFLEDLLAPAEPPDPNAAR